jgi:hypothetical protein
MTEQGREPRDHDVADRSTGPPLPGQSPEQVGATRRGVRLAMARVCMSGSILANPCPGPPGRPCTRGDGVRVTPPCLFACFEHTSPGLARVGGER